MTRPRTKWGADDALDDDVDGDDALEDGADADDDPPHAVMASASAAASAVTNARSRSLMIRPKPITGDRRRGLPAVARSAQMDLTRVQGDGAPPGIDEQATGRVDAGGGPGARRPAHRAPVERVTGPKPFQHPLGGQ